MEPGAFQFWDVRTDHQEPWSGIGAVHWGYFHSPNKIPSAWQYSDYFLGRAIGAGWSQPRLSQIWLGRALHSIQDAVGHGRHWDYGGQKWVKDPNNFRHHIPDHANQLCKCDIGHHNHREYYIDCWTHGGDQGRTMTKNASLKVLRKYLGRAQRL